MKNRLFSLSLWIGIYLLSIGQSVYSSPRALKFKLCTSFIDDAQLIDPESPVIPRSMCEDPYVHDCNKMSELVRVNTLRELSQEAAGYLNNGSQENIALAADAFQVCIDIEPRVPAFFINKAVALSLLVNGRQKAMGLYDYAIANATNIIELSDALQNLAVCIALAKPKGHDDVTTSIQLLEKAIERHPSNVVALNNLAHLYKKINSERGASLSLQALEYDPKSRDALLYLFFYCFNPEDETQANSYRDRVLELYPNNQTLLIKIAHFYAKKSKPYLMAKFYKEALSERVPQKSPIQYKMWFDIAHEYIGMPGKRQYVRALLAKSVDQHPTAKNLYALGQLYLHGMPGTPKDIGKAKCFFMQALTRDPENSLIIDALATLSSEK